MAMGTSQMLACMTDRLKQLNKNVKVDCYGQELNPETYAIAKADMLIKGGDADSLKSYGIQVEISTDEGIIIDKYYETLVLKYAGEVK